MALPKRREQMLNSGYTIPGCLCKCGNCRICTVKHAGFAIVMLVNLFNTVKVWPTAQCIEVQCLAKVFGPLELCDLLPHFRLQT